MNSIEFNKYYFYLFISFMKYYPNGIIIEKYLIILFNLIENNIAVI